MTDQEVLKAWNNSVKLNEIDCRSYRLKEAILVASATLKEVVESEGKPVITAYYRRRVTQ